MTQFSTNEAGSSMKKALVILFLLSLSVWPLACGSRTLNSPVTPTQPTATPTP